MIFSWPGTRRTRAKRPGTSVRKERLPTQELLSALPSFPPVIALREAYLRGVLHSCGKEIDVSQNVIFEIPNRITLGNRIFINRGSLITARAPVTIGDDCLIGPYVTINSGNHVYTDSTIPIRLQGHQEAPIVIEDDVWIGSHATIVAGVTIGKGAVVAAGAVVVHDIPPEVMVAGVPARTIKKRGELREDER